MKRIFKSTLLIIFLQTIFVPNIFAIEINDRNEYLFDVRRDDGDIYLNRLSIYKKLDAYDIEISIFGETQNNLYTHECEKLMFGTALSKYISKRIYISQSLQVISGQILDYLVFDTDSKAVDTTTKIGFSLPFLKYFSFDIAEEYSLNIEKGRDDYCETIAEITYNIKNSSSIGFGWHHTDRIHALDTDYVSSSLTLKF